MLIFIVMIKKIKYNMNNTNLYINNMRHYMNTQITKMLDSIINTKEKLRDLYNEKKR